MTDVIHIEDNIPVIDTILGIIGLIGIWNNIMLFLAFPGILAMIACILDVIVLWIVLFLIHVVAYRIIRMIKG